MRVRQGWNTSSRWKPGSRKRTCRLDPGLRRGDEVLTHQGFLRGVAALLLLLACASAPAGVYEDMIQAIGRDDERTVADLLKRGVDADTVTPDGSTLLMAAVKSGKPSMVKTVLAARPRINARNSLGETALMLAAFGGHLEIVQMLLTQGAEVNQSGWTPLIYSAAQNRMDIARLLLKSGAQVNAHSGSGTTALMMAAREGHMSMVLLLMQHGADLGLKNDDGATALKLARERGRKDVADMLSRAGAPE
jgi:uncharacterized protein